MKTSKKSRSTPKLTINGLWKKTGIDRRTIEKRLADAGIKDLSQAPPAAILDVIQPHVTDESSIKEKKTFEEWRKLKIRNDRDEGELIRRSLVNEALHSVIPQAVMVHRQKFVNELPALDEGRTAQEIRTNHQRAVDEVEKIWLTLMDKFTI